MADTDVTGATKEISVDTAAVKKSADNKKLVIKIVIVLVVLVAAFYIYKKFVR
jgi:hypothetical protein